MSLCFAGVHVKYWSFGSFGGTVARYHFTNFSTRSLEYFRYRVRLLCATPVDICKISQILVSLKKSISKS